MCQFCADKTQIHTQTTQTARRSLLKLAGASPLWMTGLGASTMMATA